jgi:hypothetical protein
MEKFAEHAWGELGVNVVPGRAVLPLAASISDMTPRQSRTDRA